MANSIVVTGLPPSVISCLRSLTTCARIFQREFKRELTEPNWRLTVKPKLNNVNRKIEKYFPGRQLILSEKNRDRRFGRRNEVVYFLNEAFVVVVDDDDVEVSLRGAVA